MHQTVASGRSPILVHVFLLQDVLDFTCLDTPVCLAGGWRRVSLALSSQQGVPEASQLFHSRSLLLGAERAAILSYRGKLGRRSGGSRQNGQSDKRSVIFHSRRPRSGDRSRCGHRHILRARGCSVDTGFLLPSARLVARAGRLQHKYATASAARNQPSRVGCLCRSQGSAV